MIRLQVQWCKGTAAADRRDPLTVLSLLAWVPIAIPVLVHVPVSPGYTHVLFRGESAPVPVKHCHLQQRVELQQRIREYSSSSRLVSSVTNVALSLCICPISDLNRTLRLMIIEYTTSNTMIWLEGGSEVNLQTRGSVAVGGFGNAWGYDFYMDTQNGSKL